MLTELNQEIVSCERCPRLRQWCEKVAREKRAAFKEWDYWGKPIPNFGDPDSKLLIVGLAPAAHGANRTGRMFTGDRSGEWLFRALHRAGFANQSESVSATDGLELSGVMITAVAHCAPPDNKPLPEEVEACSPFLNRLLSSRDWDAILLLGGLAWKAVHKHYKIRPLPPFGHLATTNHEGPTLVGCYHPSQQNTFTGKLTEQMLDQAMQRLREHRR